MEGKLFKFSSVTELWGTQPHDLVFERLVGLAKLKKGLQQQERQAKRSHQT